MLKIVLFFLIKTSVSEAKTLIYSNYNPPRLGDSFILIDIILLFVALFLWYKYAKNWETRCAYRHAVLPLAVTIAAFFWRELVDFFISFF